MYERCPVCGWRYEREEGYWTGAIAINLVITELLIALVAVPLAIYLAMAQQPITLLIAIGLPYALYLAVHLLSPRQKPLDERRFYASSHRTGRKLNPRPSL